MSQSCIIPTRAWEKDLSEVRLKGHVLIKGFVDGTDFNKVYAGPHRNYALSVDDIKPRPKPAEDFDEYNSAQIVWY